MSDRYYIYCKHEKEVLVPIAFMDYDGFVTVKGEFWDFRDLPKWIAEDEKVVVKTFKDTADFYIPLIEALLKSDWEEVGEWVEDLSTYTPYVYNEEE